MGLALEAFPGNNTPQAHRKKVEVQRACAQHEYASDMSAPKHRYDAPPQKEETMNMNIYPELPKAVVNMIEDAKKRKFHGECGHPLSEEQEAMLEAWKAEKESRIALG